MRVLLLMITAVMISSCGFEIVDDGYVGVKRSMGKIEKDEYKPGIHFYNPITTSIFEMETREKTWEEKLVAYSADNQIIEAHFKVNYRPNPSMMAELYIAQGDDYINVILPQRVTAPAKEVLGKYKATNLVSVRNKVNSEVKILIKERLKGTNINLIDFEITNFDYDNQFEEAVKAKVIAKEKAVEEKNRTVQKEEQAKQKVIEAKAQATAIKVKASALAKNKDLIQLEAVKKWNGVLPTMMTGNASVPFINIKQK